MCSFFVSNLINQLVGGVAWAQSSDSFIYEYVSREIVLNSQN